MLLTAVQAPNLAELVDRPVDISPLTSDLHIRLVHLPAVTDPVPARPSGLGQQRREALHPPVHRHVVDLDTALDEQLLHVAVRQPEAQVPADSNDDDVGREAEAGSEKNYRDLKLAGVGKTLKKRGHKPASAAIAAGAPRKRRPRQRSKPAATA